MIEKKKTWTSPELESLDRATDDIANTSGFMPDGGTADGTTAS